MNTAADHRATEQAYRQGFHSGVESERAARSELEAKLRAFRRLFIEERARTLRRDGLDREVADIQAQASAAAFEADFDATARHQRAGKATTEKETP